MSWPLAFAGKVATYVVNTCAELLEQILALRTAIPTLIKKEEPRKILNNMTYLFTYEVLPLIALNYANDALQRAYNSEHETGLAWTEPYAVFLTGLTVINCTVKYYTVRQGAQSFIRVTVLDSVGPRVFNENKPKLSNTPPTCNLQECGLSRKFKGWMREPVILATNDALTAGIYVIPIAGPYLSKVLRIFFHGRFITRLITPDLCERHKFNSMMQESVLAFGLSYELSCWGLDRTLELTVGEQPYLILRTMRHLLLLLHAQMAVHKQLHFIEANEATFPIDPLSVYEGMCRFAADVVFAGLQNRIPLDFKPLPGLKPLFEMSRIFEFASKILNSDLEKEDVLPLSVYQKSRNALWQVVFPPILHGTRGFINDPIVAAFWPSLQKGGLWVLQIIEKIGQDRKVLILSYGPKKTIAQLLYGIFGFPMSLSSVILVLCKDDPFWDFVNALKNWIERNAVDHPVHLLESTHVLHGDQEALSLPPPPQENSIKANPAEVLVTSHLVPTAQHAEDLIVTHAPTSTQPPSNILSQEFRMSRTGVLPANSLFSKRTRVKSVTYDASKLSSYHAAKSS